MPRRLLDDFIYRTSLLTIVRGKCGRQDARHESVCLVDGEWWGEDSRSYECDLAPMNECPVCGAKGYRELSPAEQTVAQYDGTSEYQGRAKCEHCNGTGWVKGPHWPYRWPEPPPLRIRT